MTLAERLLGRRGLILLGLPSTGRSSLLTAVGQELNCLGSVVLIPGSLTNPQVLAKALEVLVSKKDPALLLAIGSVSQPPTNTDQLFLLVDDLGCLLRSPLGDRIDLLLGTATFGGTDSESLHLFTGASLLRTELGSAEDSMFFTDRAAAVHIGEPVAPFAMQQGLERFGGWPGVAQAYRSDPVAGLGRARTALRSHLVRKLVGALTLEDIELVRLVLQRQSAASARQWDPDRYVGLAPLVVREEDRAVVPEEFVNTGLRGLLDLREACRNTRNNPQERARWFGSRLSDEVSPLWWDGHFGEQGTHPAEFLTCILREVGQHRQLRVLVHQDAILAQPQRFDELKEAIRTNPLLAHVDVRSTRAGGQQGLHDRQLYLPSLRRAVKLPIYTRLAGPYPPGDYSETWTTSRSRFGEVYTIADRAFRTAGRL